MYISPELAYLGGRRLYCCWTGVSSFMILDYLNERDGAIQWRMIWVNGLLAFSMDGRVAKKNCIVIHRELLTCLSSLLLLGRLKYTYLHLGSRLKAETSGKALTTQTRSRAQHEAFSTDE